MESDWTRGIIKESPTWSGNVGVCMKTKALAMIIAWLLPLAALGRAQEQEQEPQPEALTLKAHCSCKAAPWVNNAPHWIGLWTGKSTSNLLMWFPRGNRGDQRPLVKKAKEV